MRQLRPDEPFAKFLVFKTAWEGQYEGETYLCTGKDMKFAKELTQVDNDEIVRRLQTYFLDEWYGEHTRHSLSAFVSNINKFLPMKKDVPKPRIVRNVQDPKCEKCGTAHPPISECPPVEIWK
jgi:hypothetical protein